VVTVEQVGVVARVAEHAAGPPRRGRRLQRGGGVAREAGLEVVVVLHVDGVVVRHCLNCSVNRRCVFLRSGWEEMEVMECGGDAQQGLLFLWRCQLII
jgi:hypothetical protein